MKKSLAVMLALIMVLCMIPTTAFAKSSNASLTVSVKGTFYNPNTDKHEYFSNLRTTTHVTVNEGENPSYPVKYYFTKQTYYGSTNSSYYGKEGYKLIVTIGGKESTDLKAWVFDRDMTNVKGDGQTFYPIYSPSGYGTYQNTLFISGGTPIQPETGALTINKTVTGLPNDKLPASFTFNVMQGNNVKATVTVNKNGNNGYNAGSATLPHGTYTVVEVSATVDGYTVVTTPSNGEVTISRQPTNITFTNAYTENEPQPETPPAKPDPRPSVTPTIDGLTGVDVVEVKCITENSGHETKRYTLLDGGYTVGDVESDATSGYTCTITVKPGKYESAYNETYSGHTLVDPSQTGTIKLVWDKDNQRWKLATPSGVPVVFDVECKTTQPENPAELTSFVKSRVTAITDNMPKPPEGVTFNTNPKVTFDDNNTTANLLYSFTVTGTPGAKVTITDTGAKFYNNNGNWVENSITVTLPTESITDYVTYTVYGYRQFTKNDIDDKVLKNTATAGVEGSEKLVPGEATVPAEDKTGSGPSESPNPSPSTEPSPTPTPPPGGGNGGGGHSHYYPTTTPVPVIVIPPKTGDMTIWQSILHFLGIR